MKTNTDFWSFPAQFFLEWEMFQTKVVEKIKTYISFSKIVSENRAVYENMEKCCTAGQATDYNKAHALCMLDN